ncbi:MAG: hypothetical protein AAF203_00760 [Pseudomonadota bacterium]
MKMFILSIVFFMSFAGAYGASPTARYQESFSVTVNGAGEVEFSRNESPLFSIPFYEFDNFIQVAKDLESYEKRKKQYLDSLKPMASLAVSLVGGIVPLSLGFAIMFVPTQGEDPMVSRLANSDLKYFKYPHKYLDDVVQMHDLDGFVDALLNVYREYQSRLSSLIIKSKALQEIADSDLNCPEDLVSAQVSESYHKIASDMRVKVEKKDGRKSRWFALFLSEGHLSTAGMYDFWFDIENETPIALISFKEKTAAIKKIKIRHRVRPNAHETFNLKEILANVGERGRSVNTNDIRTQAPTLSFIYERALILRECLLRQNF